MVGRDPPTAGERHDLVALGGPVGGDLERAEADARDGRHEAPGLAHHLPELLHTRRGRRRRLELGRLRLHGGEIVVPGGAGGAHDVVAGDAPVVAGALDAREVDVVLEGRLSDGRRGERAEGAARKGGGGRGRRRLGRRGRRDRRQRDRRTGGGRQRGARALLDLGDDRLHGDDVPLGGEELGDAACHGRGQIAVGLVGRDRHERLVLGDDVPLANEPLRNRPLGDALAELGKGHVDEHEAAFSARMSGGRAAYSVHARARNVSSGGASRRSSRPCRGRAARGGTTSRRSRRRPPRAHRRAPATDRGPARRTASTTSSASSRRTLHTT